jgi:hypothetical protein
MFLDRLRLFVAERGGAQADQVANHLGQHADDDLSETTPYAENHCYVASFCSEGDLLSQWRGYAAAAAGGGYSVGFRAPELMRNAVIDQAKPVGVPGVGLYKVLYDLTAQETLIDRVLDVCFAAAEGVSHPSAWLYLADNLLGLVIPAIAPQIKAPVFREEQEWRLVAWGRSGLRFRLDRDRIVPYLTCRIPNASGARLLPILEVHVGSAERSSWRFSSYCARRVIRMVLSA